MRKSHGVPLAKFGVRKKLIPRKGKQLEFIRATDKPNAGKIFIKKKEEKTVYETKEEKHQPGTTKDFSDVSIPKLKNQITTLTKEELENIIRKDERKGAVNLAKEELAKR
jgi:hypothetical protein